jgi:NAD-dependent dihydropyrimidine dehydrogenase PreA subunit
MGVSWIDQQRCTGCGRCEMICPQDVVRLDSVAGKAFITYLKDCQSCFLCELECPQEAITVTPWRERRAVLPW